MAGGWCASTRPALPMLPRQPAKRSRTPCCPLPPLSSTQATGAPDVADAPSVPERAQVGKVYLVGAGPGDPRLITVRGVECLHQAEVVVYDRLASTELLAYVPASAEQIFVGKGPRQHTMT